MDRNEDAAFANFTFEALRLVLRDPEANQCTGQSADGRTDRRAAEGCHDRSGSDERPDTGNRQQADASHPSQRTAENAASSTAGGGAFRSLGVLFVGEVTRRGPIG